MFKVIKSSKGSIDLASVMVGVVVIGLISGVIAATVFTVIPWAQDNAAKHQLQSLDTAQNAQYGMSADTGVPTYLNSPQLAAAGRLIEAPNYCTVKTGTGDGYIAYSKSATGRVFSSNNKNTKPVLVATMPDCLAPAGTASPQTSSFIINCPTGITSAQLPLQGVTGVITWSDGVTETLGNTTSAPRTVVAGTEYTAKLEGTFLRLSSSAISDPSRTCIRAMTYWGVDSGTTTSAYAFMGASNLVSVPANLPSTVTDMTFMFANTNLFNQSLNSWDTKNVTNMQSMFQKALAFNSDIGSWNTGSVTNMSSMFIYNPVFNQNLNSWDTSKVKLMNSMFESAPAFNGNISNWNTSSATTTSLMFQNATSFNNDIGGWNLGFVTDMRNMFYNAASFNQNINNWNVSKVTDMRNTFFRASSFNQNLNSWNTSSVTTMANMFQEASSFNGSINNWDVSNVTTMNNMFYKGYAFNQPLDSWNVAKVGTMTNTFQFATVFNQNISNWNVINVVYYQNFASSSALTAANTPAFPA